MEITKVIQNKLEYYHNKINPEKKVSTEIKKENKDSLDIKSIINKINKASENTNLSLSFSRDEITGQDIIKFIDPKTKDTIKQIPSEDTLRVIEEIDKFIEKNKIKITSGTIFSKEI